VPNLDLPPVPIDNWDMPGHADLKKEMIGLIWEAAVTATRLAPLISLISANLFLTRRPLLYRFVFLVVIQRM
jgi:hypothetical protein